MSTLRPLPPRPSLEFERKEAKALLRQLRASEANALERARARHPAITDANVQRIQLSDAQLVIAREYGFSSWPWLVRYFGEVARQTIRTSSSLHSPESYPDFLKSFLAGARKGRTWESRSLAAYVPRFFGMRVEDVMRAEITEDDAKLAIARQNCCATWEMLIARATRDQHVGEFSWEPNFRKMAGDAIRLGDLSSLQALAAAHPELLQTPDATRVKIPSLMRAALSVEREIGREATQPIIDWLGSQGLSLQYELNTMLCEGMRMTTEEVRHLLDRGADPDWIAPNGISVLEHAIIKYWNGDAVDVLAAKARPRKALWISAGLGDVAGVRRFLDRDGRPTTAARENRPDFAAVGPVAIPCVPTASDEEVLMEAFFIAVVNGRANVIEYMVSRGFNVNSMVWDSPTLVVAAGNGWTKSVEALIKCGADPHLRGTPNGSAHDLALQMLENQPPSEDRRRIAQLCGIDPDAALAARDARLHPTPALHPKLVHAIELANDDALRQGQQDVQTENLLFGLLRFGELPLGYFTQLSGMDVERFHDEVRERVVHGRERIENKTLPVSSQAQTAIDCAVALATERRKDAVYGIHLLYALTTIEQGIAAQYLTTFGASVDEFNERLSKSL